MLSSIQTTTNKCEIDASGWFDLFECMMMHGLVNPKFVKIIVSNSGLDCIGQYEILSTHILEIQLRVYSTFHPTECYNA